MLFVLRLGLVSPSGQSPARKGCAVSVKQTSAKLLAKLVQDHVDVPAFHGKRPRAAGNPATQVLHSEAHGAEREG